jgi:hypothetical protein
MSLAKAERQLLMRTWRKRKGSEREGAEDIAVISQGLVAMRDTREVMAEVVVAAVMQLEQDEEEFGM